MGHGGLQGGKENVALSPRASDELSSEDHLYSVILIVLYLSSLGVRTDSIALLLFPVACPPLLLFLFLSPLQKGWHLICSSALVPSSLPLPFFSPLLSGAKGNSATEAKKLIALSRWPPLLLFLFLSPLQKGWHLICSSALVPSSLPLPFFSPLLSGAKGNSATEAKSFFLSRWELNPDLPRSAWAGIGHLLTGGYTVAVVALTIILQEKICLFILCSNIH